MIRSYLILLDTSTTIRIFNVKNQATRQFLQFEFFLRAFALHEGVQEKSTLKIVNVQVIDNPESNQMSFYSKI